MKRFYTSADGYSDDEGDVPRITPPDTGHYTETESSSMPNPFEPLLYMQNRLARMGVDC